MVEVDGKKRHLHANKIRKYNERVDDILVNNCAVIFDHDKEFGNIETVETTSELILPSQKIDRSTLQHLTEEQQSQLLEVLDRFPEVFSEKPGFLPIIEHEIKVNADFEPKRLPAYRVPEALKGEVSKQIKEMLENGIIRPSNSAMASPLVCVVGGHKGQSNSVRLAVDYRYVNKYSAGDAYPTPNLEESMERVSRARYITCCDAKSGYWQIPVKESCKWLTAFIADGKLYEFNRMPFGLKCAGNTFVRAMSIVLQDVSEFTEPFVDDMAVCSNEWEEHLDHLIKYLETIKKSGLTLNLRKCTFAQSKITFVGHVVGSGTKAVDPKKVACLSKIAIPTTKKDVRKLVGFFSYFRSFIPNLAGITCVLTDLTKKEAPNRVQWRPEHQKALELLKQSLVQAVELHSIDFSKEFGILVDASQHAIGCCLIQWSETGEELPIAFASVKLQPNQTRWSTVEREAYAVIWALKKFRPWIFWSKVTIFSDHNPLTYLTEAAPKSSKLARWSLALQEFNLTFKYRKAGHNVAADFLSRL
jgi:hypothetical protein